MKTKIIFIGLLAIMISSCSYPKYLPTSSQIDVNKFGSYIDINRHTGADIRGELISIDSNQIVVLKESAHNCVTIPITDVKNFKLQYAKSKEYAWTNVVYTLATISHGGFLLLSLPVNLIVTISVTSSGHKAFRYSDKNMTYDNLKMFARFPQGVPPNIDLANIVKNYKN